MSDQKLPGEDLISMLREKGNICVSCIVPTHRLSPERRVDHLQLSKAIEKAEEQLHYLYTEKEAVPLIQSMKELYEKIDFNHNAEGLGIFVSPHVKLLVQFPFPVQEKVIIADSFEIRDVLYKINYSHSYYILLISEKGARLFERAFSNITEIKDHHFPKEYHEEFLYNPPSRGSSDSGSASLKGFEKDKSILEAIRFQNFFREADLALKSYLVDHTPLVLVGPKKEFAWFEKVTQHSENIISKISGNYNHASIKELEDLCWPAVRSFLDEQNKKWIIEFREKIGERLGLYGIQEVWKAAKEGRALKLLVEKDYKIPGFVDTDESILHLHPPRGSHKIVADAVDDCIEIVLEKSGQVYFVDNGLLGDYGKIALITRY
jgi:hypothetical protein